MAIFDKILNSKFIDQHGSDFAPSFSFIDGAATAECELPGTPESVNAAVHTVISQQGHQLAGESDDGLLLALITKKTWLSWEIVTGIEITATPQGSHVVISMTNMPGRPNALLDGPKNTKAARKLAEQIRAAA